MGTFSVAVQVGNLEGPVFIDLEALVDTGATYTVLPEDLLGQLAIKPVGQRSFELADDRVQQYSIGYARLRLNGTETITQVVFGANRSSSLLGAVTLEQLGLAVDPVHQRLIQVNALLGPVRRHAVVYLP